MEKLLNRAKLGVTHDGSCLTMPQISPTVVSQLWLLQMKRKMQCAGMTAVHFGCVSYTLFYTLSTLYSIKVEPILSIEVSLSLSLCLGALHKLSK